MYLAAAVIVIVIILIYHVYNAHIVKWFAIQNYVTAPMLPMVILYYKSTCPACHNFMPHWNAAKKEYYDKRVLFVEQDEIKPTPGIVKYPTVIMVNDGVASEYFGPADNKMLHEWIQSKLSGNWQGTRPRTYV